MVFKHYNASEVRYFLNYVFSTVSKCIRSGKELTGGGSLIMQDNKYRYISKI